MAIVFAILLFSFLIFIHEFGHFIAAKLSGVQVNEFAIFMGPAIFKWGKGETQYSIRCIPIGGFCAMEGEDEDTDNPRSFQKSPWWKRLIILVAGSAMNFVTGFLIFLLVFSPAQMLNTPVIAQADPNCNIVSQDALQVGDRILEIGGEKVYVASNVSLLLNLEAADAYKGVAVEELASVTPATTDFLVERNGRKILLEDVSLKPLQVGVTENGAVSLMFGITLSREEADFGDILEILKALFHGHIQHFGDIFALVADFKSLAIIALALANIAGNVNIGQEMHLDFQKAIAGAGFAASAANIE